MKSKLICLALASALSAILTVSAFAQEKNLKAFSPTELTQRTLHRRAVEAVIWGMPAVNAELMFQAMHDAKAEFNQVVYWSRPLSWKNQTLTPNPDTITSCPFTTPRTPGPWCWRFRQAAKENRSPAVLTKPGRQPSKM
jgi:hypothetical protein